MRKEADILEWEDCSCHYEPGQEKAQLHESVQNLCSSSKLCTKHRCIDIHLDPLGYIIMTVLDFCTSILMQSTENIFNVGLDSRGVWYTNKSKTPDRIISRLGRVPPYSWIPALTMKRLHRL